MAVETAQLLAERAIVESVHGVNLAISGDGVGKSIGITAETGMSMVKGVEFEDSYDAKQGIAQVAASVRLGALSGMIDKAKLDVSKNPNMVIRRVGFAGTTPAAQGKVQAIRSAEVDAYRLLIKKIRSLATERGSTVGQMADKSEKTRSQMLGTLYGAEYVGHRFEGTKNEPVAFVKLKLDIKNLNDMLGEKILSNDDAIEAEGRGIPFKDGVPSDTKSDILGKKGESSIINKDLDFSPKPSP